MILLKEKKTMSKVWFDERENLVIEGAKTFWRNFSGRERKYNPAGVRNFCVRIDDEAIVKKLVNDKWNVKYIPAKSEDDDEVAYIQVAVRYGTVSPSVYLIAGRQKTYINESLIGDLDSAEIENADLIIRGRKWGDENRVKAYLKTGYFEIMKDVFADKYMFDEDEDDLPFDI